MIGIDDVIVVKIGGCCLIGNVDRMFKREVPYRKRLKLCIAGLYAAGVFVVKLRETYGKFARTRTGSGDYHQRMRSFYILVFPVAIF